jgi:phage-related protein (TIGR01555 family)
MAPKYGEPEIYQLLSRAVLPSYSGKYYSQTRMIHASRLLTFPGIRVSRYQVTTSNGGWGDSILTRMHRVLRDFNVSWAAAGVLMTDFSQAVYKMDGLYEALSTDGDDKLIARLKAMELGRSIVNAIVIDAKDEWSRQSTQLSGFPDLLTLFFSRLAASVDMPLTKLAGQSPKGLGNEGESDVVWWNTGVGNYQRTHVAPRLRRAYQIKMIQRWGREPQKWSLKFRSLEKENPKDTATARNLQAQTDKIYAVDIGSITSQEVAESRFGGDGYSFETQLDMAARKAQEAVEPQGTDAERAALRPQPGDDDYVPPPAPGSAQPTTPIPSPGPAAAPDPNTPPTPVVESGDS